jgi:hypothetical protein
MLKYLSVLGATVGTLKTMLHMQERQYACNIILLNEFIFVWGAMKLRDVKL